MKMSTHSASAQDGFLRRTFRFSIIATFLLITAQRLPAPIQEATPMAAPKPKTVAKPKPTAQPTIKPKPTPLSFAGTWDTTYYEMRLSQIGDHVSGTYDYRGGVIDGTVSGNILSGTWTQTNNRGVFRFSLSSDGNGFTGTWTDSNDSGGPWIGERKSLSQATVPSAAAERNTLPVAKPVPNKPGFVYNPFDPNSRVLLDVRGKASGTKLVEPKAAKLFVVP
jgi:hypothetical protein